MVPTVTRSPSSAHTYLPILLHGSDTSQSQTLHTYWCRQLRVFRHAMSVLLISTFLKDRICWFRFYVCMIYKPNTYSVWSFFLSENINCFSTYIQSSIHHVQIVMTLMGMVDRYSYKMTGTYFPHLRRKVRNMILSYYAQISKRFDKWEIRCAMETPHSAMRFIFIKLDDVHTRFLDIPLVRRNVWQKQQETDHPTGCH